MQDAGNSSLGTIVFTVQIGPRYSPHRITIFKNDSPRIVRSRSSIVEIGSDEPRASPSSGGWYEMRSGSLFSVSGR